MIPAPGRAVRWLPPLLAGFFLLLIAARVALEFTASSVWDDAYFFTRYADRLTSEGRLAFNPGGEATYGLTSLAFLVPVASLRAALPSNTVLPLLMSSCLFGLTLTGLLVAIAGRLTTDAGAAARRAAVLLVLFCLSFASGSFSEHFTSGMDTTFAASYMAAYVLLNLRGSGEGSADRSFLTGIVGGAAFLVRPDLLIFTTVAPAFVLFSTRGPGRRRAAMTLTASCVTAAGLMAACWMLLGSPVPLAFFVKSPGFYGGSFQAAYCLESSRQLFHFLISYPAVFGTIALAWAIDPGGWLRSLPAFQKGLLVSTALFILYELVCVTQVMPFSQRFFFPSIVPLTAVAVCSGRFAYGRLGERIRQICPSPASGDRRRICKVAFSLALFFSTGPAVEALVSDLRHPPADGYLCFDVEYEQEMCWTRYWPSLAEVSDLPDDLVIAATEVGHILALNGGKTVADMTGLNEVWIARNGFSASYLLETYEPGIIFMPHPDYVDMRHELEECPAFRERYLLVQYPDSCFILDVALDREGRYFEELRGIYPGPEAP